MSNNLELSKEQLKTLKLFAYYCASHGAKTATLSVYLNDGGSVDWMDDDWYSDSGTKIEMYDKIEELVNYILEDTSMLNYYDYNNSGSLEFEIDVPEKKLSITGHHTEYGEEAGNGESWDEEELIEDEPEFAGLFEEMGGREGFVHFNGSGDSGDIEDRITFDGSRDYLRCPKFLEDFMYRALENNYGGWEINEGSQGKFVINSEEKTVYLEFSYNTEDNVSDGVVGYVEF